MGSLCGVVHGENNDWCAFGDVTSPIVREGIVYLLAAEKYAAEIEANSSWRGYPAQLEIDEGGGGSRFEVVFTIVGDNRTFTLHFFSASPWPEAELQIYRTMIETFVLEGATEEEIDIPLEWEAGTNEGGYSIEAAVQEIFQKQVYWY